jgi:hypothetical protein
MTELVATLVMWRTLLQNGQIRFPQTSPSHNLGPRGQLNGAGWFTHFSWQRSAKCPEEPFPIDRCPEN